MGVGAACALFYSTAYSRAIKTFTIVIIISIVISVLANLSCRLMITKDRDSTDFRNTCSVSGIEITAFDWNSIHFLIQFTRQHDAFLLRCHLKMGVLATFQVPRTGPPLVKFLLVLLRGPALMELGKLFYLPSFTK